LEILPCVDPIACIEEHAIRSIPGDFDGDADVDAQDLSRFLDCLGGGTLSYPSACSPGDFDADADVDCADWSGFADAWTEPGLPPSQPKCSVSIPAVPFAKRMIIVALLLYAGACVFQGSSKRASAQGT